MAKKESEKLQEEYDFLIQKIEEEKEKKKGKTEKIMEKTKNEITILDNLRLKLASEYHDKIQKALLEEYKAQWLKGNNIWKN